MNELYPIKKLKLTDNILFKSLISKKLPNINYYQTQKFFDRFLNISYKNLKKLFKLYLFVHMFKLIMDIKKKKKFKTIIIMYFKNVLRTTIFMSYIVSFNIFATTCLRDKSIKSYSLFNLFNILGSFSYIIELNSRIKSIISFVIPHFIRSLYKYFKYNYLNDYTIKIINKYFFIISMGILVTEFINTNDLSDQNNFISKFLNFFFINKN